MISTTLTHPAILAALASAGHSARVAVVDGNFPASTHTGRNARLVHLNLTAGCVDAVTVTRAIAASIPVERAFVMQPLTSGPYAVADDPPIWRDFRSALDDHGHSAALESVEREAFYALVVGDDTALVVATGESRIYGNLVLQIGVLMPPAQTAASARVDGGAW